MSEDNKQENQIAQSIAGFLDKHGVNLLNKVTSVYRKAYDEYKLSWRVGYENYLDKTLNKYFYAKPFLSSNRPTPLTEFYVPLGVSSGGTNIQAVSIADLMLMNNFAIITASAGSGKSMMMRHLFIDTINKTNETGRIPVFIELRDLNDLELSLFELIKKRLIENGFKFSEEFIEKAFEVGHFALFLDGYDEVALGKREKTNREIQELTDKYEQNYFILSSRPDDNLYRWTLFDVWQITPLSLEQASELIEKTPEEDELKQKFIKALRDELFERHKSFLSNPLLLSIMLITYKDSANIPQKLSTFYERAYIALFERHDAQKGAYSRDKRSTLDIQDFKKVFSAFCFFSYRDEKYGDFSDTEILAYLEKAKTLVGIDFEGTKYLDDAIQAVCLLVRDGLNITFSHRSFQEYFAVLCISRLNNPSIQRRFIESGLKSSVLDDRDTLNLLFEISPEIIEKELIIPKLEEIEHSIGYEGILGDEEYKKLLAILYSKIGVRFIESKNGLLLARIFFINNLSNGISKVIEITSENYCTQNYSDSDRKSYACTNTRSFSTSVEIKNLFQQEQIFRSIADGASRLSKKYFVDVLKIKERLKEKHKRQHALLVEDTM